MLTQPQSKPESDWQKIVRLLRWDKPAGRLILMLPALWAVFLGAHSREAGSLPPLPLVGVIILGSLATSAAGCVVNDLWDRDIDPHVERTRDRPLASQVLTIQTAIVIVLVAFACAGILALYLNLLSFLLCVAAIPFIVLYPLAKRVFPVPQLVLSLNWGFAVLISWSAVTGTLSLPAWLLWGAVVLWTLGFDTVYAMPDREDDRRMGVNSSALFLDKWVADGVGLFLLGAAALLAATGVVLTLSVWFWGAWAIATLGWIWQYTQLKRRRVLPALFGRIFQQNVWLGFVLLAGMILGATG
ncbi:MAG: 4-hydroxybenzoate solanesyltransferase [Elainellaceae cyanobacterium]